MATYYNISFAEMAEFLELQEFVPVKVQGTFEHVFARRVDQDDVQLSLRVYTGINSSGASREVGEDAIRVNLFMRNNDGAIFKIGGSKRVHRVEGWRKNLQERIDNWQDYLPEHKCEKCGLPMVPRKGKNGKFLGCVGYPMCKHTRKI